MHFSSSLALAGFVYGAAATDNYLGFNSGSTFVNNSAKFESDFKAEFEAAQRLQGAPGDFNSMRLYTNIQAYSVNDPIQAFGAAIETKTNLLLGIWASGVDNITNELDALQTALNTYGSKLTDLVIAMSIGSEDLYRDSVTGVANKAGVGNTPENIVKFINSYKEAIKGTGLEGVPVGHVDTWDAWTNSSNSAVLDAVDWLGVDEYPYYESTEPNSIVHAKALFDKAYSATVAVAGGKPVWVTETGWPVSGITWNQATPSLANAKTYWDEVGCGQLFNKTPTFWYNLMDENGDNKQQFAITNDLSSTPSFSLECPAKLEVSSSSSASGSSTATASDASQTSVSTTAASASSTKGSSSNASGSTTGSAASSSSTHSSSGASSFHVLSVATYAGLLLAAGAWAIC